MRKVLLSLVMAVLSVLALASVASACTFGFYQPSLPSSLRRR